ncbi:MAG: tetratricopeptide repeat protein [Polyangiaceae bacterium]|nr:tetratricopeptide repeat protein [Polyangiaceae bacterium]
MSSIPRPALDEALRYPIAGLVGLLVCLGVAACKKGPPPDPHFLEGVRLVESDPQRALTELAQAREPEAGRVLLAKGLAYEGLREYVEAEAQLERAVKLVNEPGSWIPLARVRLMLGKLEGAREVVDRMAPKVPADLGTLLLEAVLANDEKRARAALSHLNGWPEAARTDAGPPSVPAEFHYARAGLLHRLRDPAAAQAEKAAAERAKFTEDSAAVALATLAARAGQRDLALSVLARVAATSHDQVVLRQSAVLSHALGAHALTGKALAVLPVAADDSALLALRAEHQYMTGAAEATLALRRAVQAVKDPHASEYTRLELMLADALLRQGKRDQARAELERLSKLNPKSLETQLALSRIDLIEGKVAEAIARLAPLARPGAPAAAYEVLAAAELEAEKPDAARGHLEEALRLSPQNHRTLSTLVSLYLRTGKREDAVSRLRAAIQRDPKQAATWLLLADVHRDLGKPELAETVIREALGTLPHSVQLWSVLAHSQIRRQAEKEALDTLRQAEQHNPNEVLISAEIAALLTKMGQSKEAITYYERVLKVAEGDVITLNNTAMLYADRIGNPAKAVELAEKAHRLAPASPAVTDTLGWALFLRSGSGDLERAQKLLESIGAKSADATVKYHLGRVLIAAGDGDRGRLMLREALTMPGEFPDAEAARRALTEIPGGSKTP